jgi:hypothetical protein
MIVSNRICAHCGNSYEPMPGNRGHEQRYCSPQCRRKEGKRREAMKTVHDGPKVASSRPSVRVASLMPEAPTMRKQPDSDKEWESYYDDLMWANNEAHRWRNMYYDLWQKMNQ